MSAMRPHSNRDRSLSSSVGISLGGRSDEMTICLLISWRALKVWKNSSFVLSLPARNWTSSMRSTSTFGIVPELTHARRGDGADDLIGELLRREVDNALPRKAVVDLVADRMHKVRLAKTDSAVEEQRVVAVARSLRDRLRGRMSKLRVVSDHE